MYHSIDLTYLIENSFNDALFIKDILNTTLSEFGILCQQLEEFNPQEFSPEDIYFLFHKYKPTTAMFNLKTYPYFAEYGSGDQLITLQKFIDIKPQIISDLKAAMAEIQIELDKY